MNRSVKYFEKPGRDNTDECISLVRNEVEINGYRNVVVSTTSGDTGVKLTEALKGLDANVIAVLYSTSNGATLTDDNRKKILENGATLFSGPDLTFSLGKAFGGDPNAYKIISQSLMRFGAGSKTCCECAMMATDGGLITEGMEVLAIAGSGSGADTVMVIRASSSARFQDLRVLEVLAKPRA